MSPIAIPDGAKVSVGVRSINTANEVVRLVVNCTTKNGTRYTEKAEVTVSGTARGLTGSTTTRLAEGTLESASFDLPQGTVPNGPGELWVEAYLDGPSGESLHTLFTGYVYTGHIPGYPRTGAEGGLRDGPGRRYTASGANPAAGAEVADTVPTTAWWRLIAAEVVLVTDGNAANRNVALFVDDAGATITRSLLLTDSTNQTATQTRTHGWYPGTAAVDAASVSITDTVTLLAKFPMTLPLNYLLAPGSNIRTVTTSIQAGDDYGAARYVVEEWMGP